MNTFKIIGFLLLTVVSIAMLTVGVYVQSPKIDGFLTEKATSNAFELKRTHFEMQKQKAMVDARGACFYDVFTHGLKNQKSNFFYYEPNKSGIQVRKIVSSAGAEWKYVCNLGYSDTGKPYRHYGAEHRIKPGWGDMLVVYEGGKWWKPSKITRKFETHTETEIAANKNQWTQSSKEQSNFFKLPSVPKEPLTFYKDLKVSGLIIGGLSLWWILFVVVLLIRKLV